MKCKVKCTGQTDIQTAKFKKVTTFVNVIQKQKISLSITSSVTKKWHIIVAKIPQEEFVERLMSKS